MSEAETWQSPAEPLESARESVARSDRFQGSGIELRSIRDALRALIQWAEQHDRQRERAGIRFCLTDEYRPRLQQRPVHFARAAFVEVSPSEREMVAYALRNTPMIGPDFTKDDRAAFEWLAERFER